MTINEYFYSDAIVFVTGQIILMTLFCEIIAVLWRDENAKIGAFLGESLLCIGVFIITDDIMSAMGPVMTGLTYAMIISFIIKVVIMAAHLPAAIRHCRLVSRCKRVCEQNRQLLSAEDICRICQAYCRQVRQKKLNP